MPSAKDNQSCQKTLRYTASLRIVKPLSNSAVRMVHLCGLLSFQSQILDSISTNRHSMMLCVCGVDGPSATFHPTVSVVYPSALIMHLPAQRLHSPISRHNRIRDLLADLLTEVCPCVAFEPVLVHLLVMLTTSR